VIWVFLIFVKQIISSTRPTRGIFFPESSWNELFNGTFNRSYEPLINCCWLVGSNERFVLPDFEMFSSQLFEKSQRGFSLCGITGSVYRQLLILVLSGVMAITILSIDF
jgi:hypothetical protein